MQLIADAANDGYKADAILKRLKILAVRMEADGNHEDELYMLDYAREYGNDIPENVAHMLAVYHCFANLDKDGAEKHMNAIKENNVRMLMERVNKN